MANTMMGYGAMQPQQSISSATPSQTIGSTNSASGGQPYQSAMPNIGKQIYGQSNGMPITSSDSNGIPLDLNGRPFDNFTNTEIGMLSPQFRQVNDLGPGVGFPPGFTGMPVDPIPPRFQTPPSFLTGGYRDYLKAVGGGDIPTMNRHDFRQNRNMLRGMTSSPDGMQALRQAHLDQARQQFIGQQPQGIAALQMQGMDPNRLAMIAALANGVRR